MSQDIKWENGDIVLSNTGDLATVSDLEKLYQSLQKAVLTQLGSNRYHIDYGCSIGEDTIGQGLPDWAIRNSTISSIQQTISHLQQVQAKQRLYQKVTPGEMIYALQSIDVNRDTVDPRQVNITIAVISEGLSKTYVNTTLNP